MAQALLLARRRDTNIDHRFGHLFDLFDRDNPFEPEKSACRAFRLVENLLRYDLIIIDELGYLPLSQSGGQ